MLQKVCSRIVIRNLHVPEADSLPVLDDIAKIVNPANIVDIFPVLDRLPDLLAPWRSKVIIQRNHNQAIYRGLLQNVLDDVATGKLRPEQTFASRLWSDREKLGMDDLDVAYLAGTMLVATTAINSIILVLILPDRFEAATDTTFSALATFVLAAVTYPEVFKAAQQEVDRVCQDHPPSMEHFEALEYTRAMCKETLRWRTVSAGGEKFFAYLLRETVANHNFTPYYLHTGFPHASTALKDDWFRGYRIPAGSIIIPNHWGMSLRYFSLCAP